MSFDKAIIKRFNEELSCAPPATKYDPKHPAGSAHNINFGSYSGRSSSAKKNDNNRPTFLTPAPIRDLRARTLTRSASTRSRSTSASTRSLRDNDNSTLRAVSTCSLNELDRDRNIVRNLPDFSTAVRDEASQLSEKYSNLASEYEQLLANFQSSQAEVETIKNMHQELVDAHQAVSDENLLLNSKLATAKEAFSQLETASQDERVRLEGQLETQVKELMKLTVAQTEIQAQHQLLGQKYEDLSRSYNDVNGRHAAISQKYSSLLKDHELVVENLESTTAEHNELVSKQKNIFEENLILHSKLASAEEAFSQLEIASQNEKVSLQEQLESQVKELKNLTAIQVELQTQHHLQGESYDELARSYRNSTDRHAELSRKHSELLKDHEQVVANLDASRAEHEQLVIKQQAISEENLNLNSKLASTGEAFSQFEVASRNEKDSLEEQIEFQRQELKNLTAAQTDLQTQHQLLGESYEDLSRSYRESNNRHEELSQKYSSLLNDHEQVVQNLESTRAEHQEFVIKQKNISDEEILTLNSKLSTADEAFSQLEIASQNERISLEEQLESQVKELQKLTVAQTELQAQHQLLGESYEDLSRSYSESNNRHEELSQKYSSLLNDHEQVVQNLESTRAEHQELVVAHQAVSEENLILNSKLATAEETLSQLEIASQNEKVRLQEQLESQVNELKNLTNHLSELQTQHRVLGESYADLSRNYTDANGRHAELSQTYSSILNDHEQVVQNLESTRAEHKELVVAHQAVSQENLILNSKLATTEETLSQLEIASQNEKVSLQEQLESQVNELKNLTNHLSELQTQHQLLGESYEDLSRRYDDANVRHAELSQTYSGLLKEHEQAVENLESSRAENKELIIKQENISEENLKLNSKLSSAEAAFSQLEIASQNERISLEELLESQVKELKKLTVAQTELQAQHMLLGDSYDDLSRIYNDTSGRYAELSQTYSCILKDHEQVVANLDANRVEHEQLVMKQRTISEENLKLNSKLVAAQEAFSQLETASQNERTSLEELLESQMKELKKVTIAQTELQTQHQLLGESYEELSRSYNDINGRHAELSQTYSSLLKDHEQVFANLEASRVEQEQLVIKQQTVSEENLNLNSQLVTAKEAFSQLETASQNERVTLEEQLESHMKELKKLTATVSEIQAQNQILGQRFEDLSRSYNDVNGKYAELSQTYSSLLKDHEHVVENLESTRAEHQEFVIKQKNIFEENLILHSKLASAEEAFSQLEVASQNVKSLQESVAYYERVYGDYATLVGHQNQKQRIQHVVKIKDENIKLREEVMALRQANMDLKSKLKVAPSPVATRRRFDTSQAFQHVLKEPVIRGDDKDIRGPDARSTFTIPKKTSKVVEFASVTRQQSRQGMAFDLTFTTEEKEN